MLGVDLGERRIGVAVSDSAGRLALARGAITRQAGSDDHRRQLVELARREGATHVVIGLPLGLNGRDGPASRRVRAEVQVLTPQLQAAGASVELWDERFTTVSAHRSLQQAGMSGRRRRAVVDQTAAAILLQAWLDAAAARD